MADYDWGGVFAVYLMAGGALGLLSAVAAFFGVWFVGANQFGVWAYILGWIPGLVLAVALFWVMLFAWPLPILAFAYFWFRR